MRPQFLKTLTEFSNKHSQRRLVVLIDNIDVNHQREGFIPRLRDINRRLPRNILIIVSSATNLIHSEQIISLREFDSDEVTDFVRKKLP